MDNIWFIAAVWMGLALVASLISIRPREARYATLLMFTGLTFGTISALFGLQNKIIDQKQYSILVAVVIFSALSEGDFVVFFEGDDGFFPVGGAAFEGGAAAAGLAPDVERVDLEDLDLEKLLDGLAYFAFVGAAVGDDGVLVEFFRLTGALFGHADGFDDFKGVHVMPWPDAARLAGERCV
jgi:hypothetical protein